MRFKFLFLFFIPFSAWALPMPSTEKITIAADSSLFNFKTGIDTYEGNVKIDQGTTHFTADRLVTKKNNQHKLVEAIAYQVHRPAEYRGLTQPNNKELHAQAAVIKFYPQDSTVVLEGHVVLTQEDNSFHGPKIIYNMKNGTVSVPPSNQGRSTFIIQTN